MLLTGLALEKKIFRLTLLIIKKLCNFGFITLLVNCKNE